jgi:hypothetical protein
MRYPTVDERQRQNLFYADKAKPLLRWLIETNAPEDPDERSDFVDKYQWILQQRGVLAEMGRILGKDWDPKRLTEAEEMKEAWRRFKQAAAWLGENKPSAKQAIAMLRRHRTGEARPADTQDLAHKIAVTIIEYCRTHDCTDSLVIARTLDAVRGALKEILTSQKST